MSTKMQTTKAEDKKDEMRASGSNLMDDQVNTQEHFHEHSDQEQKPQQVHQGGDQKSSDSFMLSRDMAKNYDENATHYQSRLLHPTETLRRQMRSRSKMNRASISISQITTSFVNQSTSALHHDYKRSSLPDIKPAKMSSLLRISQGNTS